MLAQTFKTRLTNFLNSKSMWYSKDSNRVCDIQNFDKVLSIPTPAQLDKARVVARQLSCEGFQNHLKR